MSIELLELAAEALGELLEEVVFVGGATVVLWITDPGAPPVRPTADVDVVVEVATRSAFHDFEARRRKRRFGEDQLTAREHAPASRTWTTLGMTPPMATTDLPDSPTPASSPSGGAPAARSAWHHRRCDDTSDHKILRGRLPGPAQDGADDNLSAHPEAAQASANLNATASRPRLRSTS
ncbi:MAG: hypothetical protein ACRDKY_00850 [Solirubrobacteraceae bacterium]